MTKSHAILFGPLLVSLAAIAFCVWSALGNDVNFCVTTGCTLYQDFTVAGISLWWFGSASFAFLCICALLGQNILGKRLAGLFVLGDTALLLLMAFTAPCVSCLVAALLFALCYFLFRRTGSASARPGESGSSRHSLLLWAWGLLFAINLGQVARSEIDIWPVLDQSGDAATRMFFSVDCPYCAKAIHALSGKVDVAFYPVSENPEDVYRIAKMMSLLDDGMNMSEALDQSGEYETPEGFAAYSPEMMLLRFRLLRNKAHIFAAGSQAVPFFEQRGLPVGLLKENASAESQANSVKPENNFNLPPELTITGQCGSGVPCPPDQAQMN